MVDTTLSGSGCEVIQADNGASAVEIARRDQPGVILMDAMMPGKLDGYEATRLIKGNPETNGCTIIMLTARGQLSDKEEGAKAGADYYMIKPFSPLELLQRVETIFREAES